MKRPTQRDIARIAKVTHVTVSLALRGHPSIPKATRERIDGIAKQINYRPDPALSALMLYRRAAKPSSYQGVLAWINSYRNPELLASYFPQYLRGAQERCEELGYKLEEFRMTDLGMNYTRLSGILRARNIQGVLFAPQDRRRHITKASFDWDSFSAISFGYSLMRPSLDLVGNAQYRTSRLAVRKLRALGYHRIGFVTGHRFNERLDQNFMAGFLVEELRFLPSERVPVYFMDEKGGEESFRNWFFRYAPDVLMIATLGILEWFYAMPPAERKGCGIAGLDVPDGDKEYSGVNQNNKIIGRTAVDMVVAKVHANERGIPVAPRRILIEGRWMPGTTAPKVGARAQGQRFPVQLGGKVPGEALAPGVF